MRVELGPGQRGEDGILSRLIVYQILDNTILNSFLCICRSCHQFPGDLSQIAETNSIDHHSLTLLQSVERKVERNLHILALTLGDFGLGGDFGLRLANYLLKCINNTEINININNKAPKPYY